MQVCDVKKFSCMLMKLQNVFRGFGSGFEQTADVEEHGVGAWMKLTVLDTESCMAFVIYVHARQCSDLRLVCQLVVRIHPAIQRLNAWVGSYASQAANTN